MATLYLTEQGATLRKDSRRFIIELGGEVLAEVHEFKVDRVVVFGNIQITTQAIAFLFSKRIDTAFMTMQGKLKGRLTPLESRNVPLRLRHYELSQQQAFALEISKRMIAGKIANSISILARYQRNHPDVGFTPAIDRMSELQNEAMRKRTLESLRGVEGQSAAIYFECFGRMLRNDVQFSGRSRRPPTDPVNALLSFGYTLLYNEAIGVLALVGFDPYLGFFHGINYGRCSLALDLMEEFRHIVVDRLVVSSINLGMFQRHHFDVADDGGFYLKEEPRKKFLKEYEKLMTNEFLCGRTSERISFRKALHEQALMLQRVLMNKNVEYESFKGWR